MPTLDEFLGGVPSYFFGNRPSGPGSYAELQARRKIAETMLGKRSPFPQNVGQGLTYLGERLGDVAMWRGLQGQEAAQSGLLQGDAKKAAESDETPTAPPEPAAPYPRLPQPGRFDPNIPAIPPGSSARPTVAPGTAAVDDTTDPRDAIALAAMPSFTAASGERPAPMPSAPAIDRSERPTGFPMPPPRPVYDRNRQIAELQANPALEQRMLTIAKGEVGNNPRAQQLIAETIMNRAAARDQPLEQVMRQYTGPRSSGYYPPETFGMGRASPEILTPVLRGSDEGGQALGFAPTGNASGGVAARGVASGRYNAAGRLPGSAETFVQQEPPEQLARLAGTRLGPGASATDAIGTALVSPGRAAEGGGSGEGGGGGPGGGNPPIATDIPPAPDAAAPRGPGFSPQPGALPGAPPAKQQEFPESVVPPFVQPKPPPQTPETQREREATLMWYRTADNPPRQAIWANVIANEQAKRKFIDDRNIKVFDAELEKYKTDVAKWREGERGRQATQIEAAKKIQELRQNEPTPVPGATGPGGAPNPLLGTPDSPQRTGVPNVIPMGNIPLAKAAEQQGPAMVKALDATKTAIPEFANALKTIELTLKHPDLGSATGLGGTVMRRIPGTAAYDPGALLSQIENENFLSAYNILRGGGQISNVEGEKAQRAKANIDPKQSEAALRASLLRLENQMRLDMETAQRKMNMPVTAWRRGGDNESFAPDIGQVQDGHKFIGGDPGLPSSWVRIR